MAFPYKITDKARQDLREAIEYYRQRGNNLPNRFLKAFIDTRQQICEFPHTHQVIVKNRRRANFIGKFPYFIFYIATKKEVIIIAVMHQKRKPKTWKKRNV